MKRVLMIAVSLMFVVTMAACGNNDNNTSKPDTNKDPVVNSEQETPNEDVNQDNNDVNNNQDNNVNNNGVNNNLDNNVNNNDDNNYNEDNAEEVTASDLDGFEEADIVKSHIDDLDALSIMVQVDNSNKRIILYKDGNNVQYKSIFIKNDEHLKIINTHENDDLIYNDNI